jgi:uncharacterized membrane protein
MLGSSSRFPATLSLVGCLLGLLFASYSTMDYAEHLDRGLHDVHCSFIPGAPPTSEAEACRAAMYSPYSAVFRESMWGGVPISLFALGAFAFLGGFALYLWLARERAPKVAVGFFAGVGITPLLISLLMLTISVTKLGHLCKTCVGIYISSFLLAIGAVSGLFTLKGGFRPALSVLFVLLWLMALGGTTLVPAAVYAASVPDQRSYLGKCGTLKQPKMSAGAPVKIHGSRAIQPVLFFEDPLCPTCRAFHERLLDEGVFERLDVDLLLFPLDSECNWMLESPIHPGACIVSKAVLCGGARTRQVLEWAYDEQVYLTRAGKAGANVLRAAIKQKWGDDLLKCVDDRKTDVLLNQHLHFASDNSIPVSTPQMYLGGTKRVCDEDTDMGLRFALKELAPEVLK